MDACLAALRERLTSVRVEISEVPHLAQCPRRRTDDDKERAWSAKFRAEQEKEAAAKNRDFYLGMAKVLAVLLAIIVATIIAILVG